MQVITLGIPVLFVFSLDVLAVHHCRVRFHLSSFSLLVVGMYLACAHIEYKLYEMVLCHTLFWHSPSASALLNTCTFWRLFARFSFALPQQLSGKVGMNVNL